MTMTTTLRSAILGGLLGISALGASGCRDHEAPPPAGVTFFNRDWTDTDKTRYEGKELHFSFAADRWRKEDRNPGPGNGVMVIHRASEFERMMRSGHFYERGERDIEFVDHLREVRWKLRYRLYDCKSGRFDLCAEVEGLDGSSTKRTLYSIRGKTNPGPPPDDDR